MLGTISLRAAPDAPLDEHAQQSAQEIARQLGIAFNQARLFQAVEAQAHELEKRVEERTRELRRREQSEHRQRVLAEAMLDIARTLNSTLDLDHVLENILLNLERVVAYQAANVVLQHDGTAQVALWRGERHVESGEDLDMTFYRHILQTSETLVIADAERAAAWGWSPKNGNTVYVGVPIRSGTEVHGILNVYIAQDGPPSATQLNALDAFAQQAAVAINNVFVLEQKQKLAALEERQRFGRDLHDAISQSLFTLSIMAESAVKTTDRPKQSRIISLMVDLARGAYAEMRLLLYELRSSNADEGALPVLLTRLAQAFKARTGRTVSLSLPSSMPTLPGDATMQLYRIVQEALNNISKYARVGEAAVQLTIEAGQLVLVIRDSGPGFDVEAKRRTSHGLSIMHERAEKIDAAIQVISEIGVGTQVRLTMPLH